jgi:hypothetical protein
MKARKPSCGATQKTGNEVSSQHFAACFIDARKYWVVVIGGMQGIGWAYGYFERLPA